MYLNRKGSGPLYLILKGGGRRQEGGARRRETARLLVVRQFSKSRHGSGLSRSGRGASCGGGIPGLGSPKRPAAP